MSLYKYRDEYGFSLRVDHVAESEGALVRAVWPNGVGVGVNLPAAQRQAAAQALAGDEWRVVSAKQRPFDDGDPSPGRSIDEVIGWDDPQPIDPADVKVGDVVEVSHDGPPPWRLEGTVIDRPAPSGLTLPPYDLWISFKPGGELLMPHDATVRLVRRAVPDPDPEQVEALAEVMRSLPPIAWDSSEEYARELVRQGVTVRKET